MSQLVLIGCSLAILEVTLSRIVLKNKNKQKKARFHAFRCNNSVFWWFLDSYDATFFIITIFKSQFYWRLVNIACAWFLSNNNIKKQTLSLDCSVHFPSTPAITKPWALWRGGKRLSTLMSHHNISRAMSSRVPCDNAERGSVGGWGVCTWFTLDFTIPLPTCSTPPAMALLIKGHLPLQIRSLSFKSPDKSAVALRHSCAVFLPSLIHSVSIFARWWWASHPVTASMWHMVYSYAPSWRFITVTVVHHK